MHDPGPVARALLAVGRPSVRATLVVLLAAVLFVGLPWKDQSLTGDTVVYAQTGAEIVERGDPTRLTFDGRLAPNKPPLVFWMLAAVFAVLGKSDATASLPSQLAGLATVVLLMRLVARRHGRRTAFWAGLACATWAVFQRAAHTCRLETPLTFLQLAAVGVFLRIDCRGAHPLRSLGLGALVGLAVLAKGPAGLVAAGAIAAGGIAAGRGRLLLQVAPWALLALVAVSAPWYALQILREGPAWWSGLRGDWARTTAPVHGLLPAVRFYLTDVFLPALPWVPPLVLGAALAGRRVRRDRRGALAEAVLLAWVLCLLVALSALRMHYSRYFVQVVPAFAWLGGLWLAPALRRLARASAVARAGSAHALVAMAIAGVVLAGYPVYLLRRLGPPERRYEAIGAAVRLLGEVAPGSRVLPTWSLAQERSPTGTVSLPSVAAGRFYYDARLVPFREGDRDQPPVVLFLHGARGPADAAGFEARHGYRAVRRTADATVYLTR